MGASKAGNLCHKIQTKCARLLDILETFQTLYGILWKLVMSQHLTIEQYQTYKSIFVYTNIYKLQFIKMQDNSHCYTCPLYAKTDTCNVY